MTIFINPHRKSLINLNLGNLGSPFGANFSPPQLSEMLSKPSSRNFYLHQFY